MVVTVLTPLLLIAGALVLLVFFGGLAGVLYIITTALSNPPVTILLAILVLAWIESRTGLFKAVLRRRG